MSSTNPLDWQPLVNNSPAYTVPPTPAPNLSASDLQALQSLYSGATSGSQSASVGGNTYGTTGVQTSGEDGSGYTPNSLIQYDPNNMSPGTVYNVIDPATGRVTGQNAWQNGGSTADLLSSTVSDLAPAVMLFASLYGLGTLGAGLAGAGGLSGTTGASMLGQEVDPMMYGGGSASTWGAGGYAGDLTSIGYDPAFGTGAADSVEGGIAGLSPDQVAAMNAGDINGMDLNSDIATNTGTVPPGSINAGISTTMGAPSWGPTINGTSPFGSIGSTVGGLASGLTLSGLGSLAGGAGTLVKALTGGGSGSGSGSGGGGTSGGGGGSASNPFGPTTMPKSMDAGWNYAGPPGWRTDRPLYVPGQDVIPMGWLGAGGQSA